MAVSIQRLDDLRYGLTRRDVVFLRSDEDAELDAVAAFRGLKKAKHRQEMLDRFDLWKRTDQHHDHYFHGFNQEGYRDCIVFKRKQAGTYYRYYGFLFHPHENLNPRYELAVLVNHAQKNQPQTDPAELNTVNKFKNRGDVITAIRREFPERPGGTNATLHIVKQ
jgi:hypothetical protein